MAFSFVLLFKGTNHSMAEAVGFESNAAELPIAWSQSHVAVFELFSVPYVYRRIYV